MYKNWKNETCKGCYFRLHAYCHRFPPSAENSDYPKIWCELDELSEAGYSAACAEFRRASDVQPTKKKHKHKCQRCGCGIVYMGFCKGCGPKGGG